ncbi:MAG: hypothetical protein ACKVQT_11660 [Burkholderiales bacterium]
MSSTRRNYRTNSPEAAARVIATLVSRDGRLDWRELEFLDDAGALHILGIERGRFLAVLSHYLGERVSGVEVGRNASAKRDNAELDAIDDPTTQLIVAALLLYLAEIDGVQAEEREFVRRAWKRWNVTPEMLEREMKISVCALARGVRTGRRHGLTEGERR